MGNHILSDECWMKGNRCGKSTFPDCECLHSNIQCNILNKLYYLFNQTLLARKQWERAYLYNTGKHFDILKEYDINILENVKNGKNLYIHSSTCGNGKTTWAVRLIQDYLYAIWGFCTLDCHALFINVPRYLFEVKNNISNHNAYAEHVEKYILTADLVVWDDIATKVSTEYEKEKLLSLIDARINSGKTNIYTSNASKQELYKQMGDRLASRIYNDSIDVEVIDVDRRGYK